MEISDFIPFLVMMVYSFIPFGTVYLSLHTLNWNDRKNLFPDSWIIFITWLISSFVVYIFCLSAEYGFYKLFHGNIYVTFFPVTLAVNIISISVVLKARESEENLSVITNSNEEKFQKKDKWKIWKTSTIVSILTLSIVTSLFIFTDEISTRMEKLKPKSESGYAVYE